MASDGSANLDDPLIGDVPAQRSKPLGELFTHGAIVGVHHIDGVAFIGLADGQPLGHHVHTLAHAHGLARQRDPALDIHGNQGLDLRQTAQGIHRMGDAPAPVEILQIVDHGIQLDPIPDGIQTGNDPGGIQPLIPQAAGLLHQEPLSAGGVSAVINMGVGVFHILAHHAGGLISAAEGRGQGDIDKLLPRIPG